MTKYYHLSITHYGDDWHDVAEEEVFHTENEANEHLEQHKVEYKNVSGIEYIEGYVNIYSKEQLKDIMTYRKFVDFFDIVDN